MIDHNKMTSLTDVLNEFQSTFHLQWYLVDDDTAPPRGWTAPDWKILLGHRAYLVHSCKLGEKSNFFCSLMNQAESCQAPKNETDLTHLLPATCHDTWELVLNFMYQDRVLHGAPQEHGHRIVTGPNIVTVENAVSLFKIAHVLRIPTLAHHCVHWMSNNQDVDTSFDMLSAAIELAPGLDCIENMCIPIIARNFGQVDINRFLSLDLKSLTQIFVDTSDHEQQKLCEVTVHYLRKVEDKDQEQVFVQLSPCVRQVHTKDALFLYSLSLTHGSERLCALCLPVLSQQYEQLDHSDLNKIEDDVVRCALTFNHDTATLDTMYTMDVETVDDILKLAERDFTVNELQMSRFIVNYVKKTSNGKKNVVFSKLSKYINQIHSKDALYIYGLSDSYTMRSIAVVGCPEGALRVKAGLNSLKNALKKVKEYDINQIFLENGVHDEQGEEVDIDFPVTIIGESTDGCTIIGGLRMLGKEEVEGDVNVKNLTISQSKGHGVSGGCDFEYCMAFHLFNLNIEKSKRGGVFVYGSKRTTMSNCQVSHSKEYGVRVRFGLMTINGSGTSIHNNGTSGLDTQSSVIHLVSPLTEENISINNGSGGDYAGAHTIKTIRSEEQVLCCVDAEGTLHVRPGLNSLLNAVIEANLYNINQIFLENGVHDEEGGMVDIDCPVTIIGESKDGCTIIGGLRVRGKEEDDVNVKHLTISQSKDHGVDSQYAGMSFHLFNLNIEKSKRGGVYVNGSKRNIMSNCQVSHSKEYGVGVESGLLTMNGSGTSIHNNVISGYSDDYGMITYDSWSFIHLVSPLTKENISINNGGGGDYGTCDGKGMIKTIRSEEQVLCCVDAEGTLHVRPGLNSLLNAVIEANLYNINQIFLENGVHNEQGEIVDIDCPVTIIGESKDGCIIIGGLRMLGNKEDDVNVKNLTISQSKGHGVSGECEGFPLMSFHLCNLNIEKSGRHGVCAYYTKRNTMSNCQVSHSKGCGVRVWSYPGTGFVTLMTMNGDGTSIHNNVTGTCTGGDIARDIGYGLSASSSSSFIHLVSPLTKENISINNGGGGDYGGAGTIETIEMKNEDTNQTEQESKEIHQLTVSPPCTSLGETKTNSVSFSFLFVYSFFLIVHMYMCVHVHITCVHVIIRICGRIHTCYKFLTFLCVKFHYLYVCFCAVIDVIFMSGR